LLDPVSVSDALAYTARTMSTSSAMTSTPMT
jgi:hypothetical protein